MNQEGKRPRPSLEEWKPRIEYIRGPDRRDTTEVRIATARAALIQLHRHCFDPAHYDASFGKIEECLRGNEELLTDDFVKGIIGNSARKIIEMLEEEKRRDYEAIRKHNEGCDEIVRNAKTDGVPWEVETTKIINREERSDIDWLIAFFSRYLGHPEVVEPESQLRKSINRLLKKMGRTADDI